MGQIIRSLASVCLCVCLSICMSVIAPTVAILNMMKLCTVVWGRKTEIEFVGGQNPVMPSLFYLKIEKFIMALMGKFEKIKLS